MFLRRAVVQFYPLRRRCFSSHNSLDLAVAELNKEMESVFGMQPCTSLGPDAINNFSRVQEPTLGSQKPLGNELGPSHINCQGETSGLSHINNQGETQMVDVSRKEDTKRLAIASCRVILGEKVFKLVAENQITKGDVLHVAKIAGISGAKQTSNLIPLCHNISLTHIRVDLKLNEKIFSVDIEGEAATTGKTGVEMEAMTAVTIAGLTVYDMCKAASKNVQITDVRLEHKKGGKSGQWTRHS